MLPLDHFRANGRVFSNERDVIYAARETGLEVEVIVDLSKLELKDTVRKMSGVGIVIAAHGAALINSIFLPQVCKYDQIRREFFIVAVFALHSLFS